MVSLSNNTKENSTAAENFAKAVTNQDPQKGLRVQIAHGKNSVLYGPEDDFSNNYKELLLKIRNLPRGSEDQVATLLARLLRNKNRKVEGVKIVQLIFALCCFRRDARLGTGDKDLGIHLLREFVRNCPRQLPKVLLLLVVAGSWKDLRAFGDPKFLGKNVADKVAKFYFGILAGQYPSGIPKKLLEYLDSNVGLAFKWVPLNQRNCWLYEKLVFLFSKGCR